jgi:hydrogenase nickel incorporation protein HypA/HybF
MLELARRLTGIAREHGVERIGGVRLRVGALAPVSAAHLRAHLAHALRGTPAEGARLEIETTEDVSDARAQCVVIESVDVTE